MRIVGEALHERVRDDEAHAGGPQEDRVPVQLQQDQQAQSQLATKEHQRVEQADLYTMKTGSGCTVGSNRSGNMN